jgi:hypothetical protein
MKPHPPDPTQNALAFASIQIIIAPALLILIHYCYETSRNIIGLP